MDDILSMRYAHCDGHTDICYDDTGKYLVTCGMDGDIRIFDGFEDDDPQSHHMGNSVSAVAMKNDKIYVSPDNFSVSAYSFPSAEFDQIIAQFNTTVYHIVCSKDGNFVACGGGDFIIKVYDTTTKSLIAFRGHDGPVLSLAFDPKGKYLASSGCDGTVRIWEIASQECIKTLNLFKKSNDLCTSSTLCRIDWSIDGQFLAIPVDTEVRFYQRGMWKSTSALTDECITKTASIVTYSPFGKYIAAAAMNGQMLVWDTETNMCVSRKLHEKEIAVCGLKWNPSGRELLFCDVEGQIGIYSSPLSLNTNVESDLQQDEAVYSEKDMGISDDEDNDNAFDIGAIKASLEPKIFGIDTNEDEIQNIDSIQPTAEPKVQIIEAPKAPVQKAFQPSSTPVNLERRFMLWNNIGIVRCYNTEEENSIDVEFHDSNIYHPLHLNNTRNHTLAALSTEALLLASPKSEGNASKLECLHFGTWDSNKEWIIEMCEDEEIEAIALGDGFAVCVTDKRFVRLFSISGIQCEVFLLPGPVVCCSSKSDQLLIAYHKGSGIDNDQCLNMMLVKVKIGGHCSVKECLLPLSPKAFLTWLGYTDEGHPCIVDTAGIVSLLSVSCGTKWIPICNTTSNTKGKSDTYFIIGLSEIKQEIRCILCKCARYPSLLPRPTIAVLQFSLPFCELSNDKGKLEEENQRYSLAHKCIEALMKEGFDLDSEFGSVEKKWMDVLLKMFALATRSDREYRAMDVAELMPNPVIVQGAIRYATQRHRIALAERLGQIMNKKLIPDVELDDDSDGDFQLTEENFSESLISKDAICTNLSFAKADNVLKPKPLLKRRSNMERSVENIDETLDIEVPTGVVHTAAGSSRIAKNSPVSNPFRANSKMQAKKEEFGNKSGIDDLLNSSMKTLSSRNSTSSFVEKPKKSRFLTKKDCAPKPIENGFSEKAKSGFSLYLEENKEEIKATAPPDVTEKDLVKMAMKLFKELPKSEKEKYQKNLISNSSKENKTENNNDSESQEIGFAIKESENELQSSTPKAFSTKRKDNSVENNDDPTPKPKKIKSDKLSDTSIKKLTQFAFTKSNRKQ